jgi:hypothetical protein
MVGAGAAFQPLMPTGEQSGLQTHIAAMESATLCLPMKRLTAFLELESAIRAVTQNQIVAGRRLAWSDWSRHVPTPDGLKKAYALMFQFPQTF